MAKLLSVIQRNKLSSSLKKCCNYLPALLVGPSWVSSNFLPEPSKPRQFISLDLSLVSLCTAPFKVSSKKLTFSVAVFKLLACLTWNTLTCREKKTHLHNRRSWKSSRLILVIHLERKTERPPPANHRSPFPTYCTSFQATLLRTSKNQASIIISPDPLDPFNFSTYSSCSSNSVPWFPVPRFLLRQPTDPCKIKPILRKHHMSTMSGVVLSLNSRKSRYPIMSKADRRHRQAKPSQHPDTKLMNFNHYI